MVEVSRANMNTSIAHYKIIMSLLEKYEELNYSSYVNGDESKLVITDSHKAKFKKATDNLINSYQNPYHELYHWIKGEIYDIQAMTECVAGRDNIEVNKNKLEGKNSDMESGRRSTMS